MKYTSIWIIMLIWLLITGLLCFSIIGWPLLIKMNGTNYYKYGEECRTVWIQFGYDLKEYLLK